MGIASGPLFDRRRSRSAGFGREGPSARTELESTLSHDAARAARQRKQSNSRTRRLVKRRPAARKRRAAGEEPPDPTKSSEPRLGVDRACRTASGHETAGLLNEPRRTRRGEATTPSVLSETYKISGTNDVQIVRFLLFLLLVSNRRCAREPIARGDGRGASGPNRPAQAKGRTGLLRYGCVTVLTATRVSRKLRTSRGTRSIMLCLWLPSP